ncbi:MAG: hypothetical protein M1830_001519 [Pleopsidium flavum]|nr:MAG: hypothetical protein M1830_001519 [Pleopsidium flavum]
MLSGASGTTDFFEAEPAHMPSVDVAERDEEELCHGRDRERNGSGSGSGSGSGGSQRDPMSPLARHVASPVGSSWNAVVA